MQQLIICKNCSYYQSLYKDGSLYCNKTSKRCEELNQIKTYKKQLDYLLKTIGALSNLFSESHTPYLDYRVVENIFCKSFKAVNLARFDCSADAKKDDIGIGIKTFLHKTKNQKIAEFNEFAKELKNKEPGEQVFLISKLRNERIEFTKRNYGISKMIYHLVTRDDSKFYILETIMI